jgi:hypothetical protein
MLRDERGSFGVFEEIERLHWKLYSIGPTEILLEPNQVYTTRALRFDNESFCALMVSAAQVELLWGEAR